jgi:predicted phosphodiesterase
MPKPASLKFDLVSDLHVDHWDQPVDWAALRQNDVVIVAGDVANSLSDTKKELERLAKVYKTVLYIDGNHEYCEEMYKNKDAATAPDFDTGLRAAVADLPNVHFLKDGPVIIGGVAVVGRNGHWDYKSLDGVTVADAQDAVMKKIGLPLAAAGVFSKQARQDVDDLKQIVKELNADPAVETILVVTHTLPLKALVPRRLAFPGGPTSEQKPVPPHFSNLGNSDMAEVLAEDTNKKIGLWVFGHWHGPRDQTVDGVHYISHPRGSPRKDKPPYKPLALEAAPRAKTPPPGPAPAGPSPAKPA